MLKLIHRAGSCENGPCPNAFDVAGDGREGWAAVQGTTVAGTATTSAVMVPRQLILEYAALTRDAAPPAPPAAAGGFGVANDGPEHVIITGEAMTDPAALAQLSGMPAHESVVLVPRRLIAEYAGQR